MRLVARLAFRLEVSGAENVPRRGPLIIAANHQSFLDIPLLGCALPRRVDNIAKAELFSNRLVARFFLMLGGIPLRRGSGDSGAVFEAIHRLRAGRALVIYPEGTRSPDGKIKEAKAGIGMIVAYTGVPVLPALIEGTGSAWGRSVRRIRLVPVRITFGKPIDFRPQIKLHGDSKAKGDRKVIYERIAREVMRQIDDLRPEPAARRSGLRDREAVSPDQKSEG